MKSLHSIQTLRMVLNKTWPGQTSKKFKNPVTRFKQFQGLLLLGMLTGLDFPGSRKNFPFPGKNSRMGEFREIAYNPSLRNSVATVRKLTGAAFGGVISFKIVAGVY